jgi:hypothetical protein
MRYSSKFVHIRITATGFYYHDVIEDAVPNYLSTNGEDFLELCFKNKSYDHGTY